MRGATVARLLTSIESVQYLSCCRLMLAAHWLTRKDRLWNCCWCRCCLWSATPTPFVAHLTAPPATSCRELYQALLQISPTCACAQLHLRWSLLLSHHQIGHIFGRHLHRPEHAYGMRLEVLR